ncbi:MAG TPA: caspase family protein [Bryobacteraceae bacterium]|nr:caspase family protein [Bryobacteraceae bacterium]
MSSKGRNSGALLPFEPLLDHLHRQGFHIGVEHHLRVRMLLNRVAADCQPSELKTLLCPIFATNAEQQDFFYRTFDEYYPFLRDVDQGDAGSSPTASQPPVAEPSRVVRRWPYLAAAGIAIVLSVAFLTWKTQVLRPPAQPSSPPPSEPASTPAQPTPRPERTPAPAAASERDHRVSSRVTRVPPSVSPMLAWYSTQRIVLGWTAVMGPLLSWLFYEVYRFRRRRLLIRKAQGKVPPYSWPIRTELPPDIYPPHDLAVVSRLLHRRYQGEAERLDVAATVDASIAALGFPTFRYRKDSRLPEYLFLIDRAGFRDHQARLYEHLAAVLHGQGLYVSVYFYEGDPRVCWNTTAEESVSLEQLLRMCSGYRLLLFGNGEQLLDAVTGRLTHWHRLLTAWPDRAVLTPEPPSEWGLREMTLATQFALAPATLEGLASLAAYFELPSSVDLRDWRERGGSARDSASTDMMDALRRYLGEDTFQWLCACAIYPELQWDLTLRIGALPSLPAGLVREENLVKLLGLEWFRAGSMLDDLRRELIGQLDPKVQREVREAIIGLLESNPPPTDTFAANAHQFQIAFQRLWANPKDRKARRDLKAALENISPDELAQDYAYLDAAESVSQSPLQLLLPSRLRKLIFPAGASWFGIRSAARLALLAAAIVGALLLLRLGDWQVKAAVNRYSAELSNGLGLSMVDLGGRVRVSWSTDSQAVRNARSGVLAITDGDKSLTLPLGPDELRAGRAEYPALSANLQFLLTVTDEAQNGTSEQAALQLSRAPKTAAQQQPGAIQIAGKVFHPPVMKTIARGPAQIDVPPAIQPDTGVTQVGNAIDRALTFTGVLPPPVRLPSGVRIPTKETPVGLVLNGVGAKLLRADTETPLTARPGDLLFARDGLRTVGSTASFLFCPAKAIVTLSASGEVRLDDKQFSVKMGEISEAPARACTLPQTLRVPVASQQHYGVTMSHGTAQEVSPTPRDKLAPDVQAVLAPLDVVLKSNPNDQGALITSATIFESRKLYANAIDMYNQLLKQWPDAEWIKAKRFDLEQALVASNTPPPTFDGKTYALLIGISKYSKPELQLRFADADARSMAQFLQSSRGGGLPADQLLLLTNEKATTSAVRFAFQEFLKRRVTKNGTLIILLVGHGTVEGPGKKNAYFLTYDADPQDLKTTALPMAELQSLFEEQVSKAGRVVLFVDVSRSGTIGTIQSNSVNASVADLQDVEGQFLGLMAGRKRELSYESPNWGGGHGAFAYFLITGLQGAADENGDGVVDGGELIRYVSAQVPRATNDKQHPTDISPGIVDIALSDIRKPGINF